MVSLKKRSLVIALLVVFVLGAALPIGGLAVSGKWKLLTGVSVSKDEFDKYKYLEKTYSGLDKLKKIIEAQSLYPLSDEQLVLGMKRGLFAGIDDPYSNYLTKGEYDSLLITATGELQGIGITMNEKNNLIEVVSTFKNSPARKAGLESGDIILKIDGQAYDGMKINEAASAMRGKPGTKVKITYSHGGKVKEAEIIRAQIDMESVFATVLDGNLGYIEINAFENKTGDDFEKALQDMEKQGVKGLIIDLRNNGGGVVDSGIKVADLLLDEAIVSYTENKQKEREYYKSSQGKTKLPYVLLVNNGTASTAEIVTAGIKENGGGKVIGEKTYGKGIIQKVEMVNERDGMRLTVMEYYSPKGNKIQKIGVTPSIEVPLKPDDKKDYQLEKAKEVLMEDRA